MSAARGADLHAAVIRDHFLHPRNRGALDGPATTGHAHNAHCGDTVRISVRVENGVVAEVAFDGRGCTISQAAASMLTKVTAGQRVESMPGIRSAFAEGLASQNAELPEALGDLRALVGVRRFPSRVRCAVLPFEALAAALREETLCNDNS